MQTWSCSTCWTRRRSSGSGCSSWRRRAAAAGRRRSPWFVYFQIFVYFFNLTTVCSAEGARVQGELHRLPLPRRRQGQAHQPRRPGRSKSLHRTSMMQQCKCFCMAHRAHLAAKEEEPHSGISMLYDIYCKHIFLNHYNTSHLSRIRHAVAKDLFPTEIDP